MQVAGADADDDTLGEGDNESDIRRARIEVEGVARGEKEVVSQKGAHRGGQDPWPAPKEKRGESSGEQEEKHPRGIAEAGVEIPPDEESDDGQPQSATIGGEGVAKDRPAGDRNSGRWQFSGKRCHETAK